MMKTRTHRVERIDFHSGRREKKEGRNKKGMESERWRGEEERKKKGKTGDLRMVQIRQHCPWVVGFSAMGSVA
jgi:hypothetical protein